MRNVFKLKNKKFKPSRPFLSTPKLQLVIGRRLLISPVAGMTGGTDAERQQLFRLHTTSTSVLMYSCTNIPTSKLKVAIKS